MNADDPFKRRKHIRLKDFDYSSSGLYFITICTEGRQCVLSKVTGSRTTKGTTEESLVGRGLAPAVELTDLGIIAEKQLCLLPQRFSAVQIRRYVIMPNHIHMIVRLDRNTAGASPRPTIMDVVCAYKSLTTIECNKLKKMPKLFQTSFHEHIIRNKQEYFEISNYITNNPILWEKDKYHI